MDTFCVAAHPSIFWSKAGSLSSFSFMYPSRLAVLSGGFDMAGYVGCLYYNKIDVATIMAMNTVNQ
jgi:hypothetical protein